ncbi:MAG: hypothetical protein IIA49_03435 [Bacteroidetes bacterium]|nr:hypothetical protein [Bacteroidota bacterium]
MKLKVYLILIPLSLLSYACRENNGIVNNTASTHGGIYTEVGGNISGTLNLKDSPFLIISDIIISENDTLIIEAGVTLFFEERRRLIADGIILANGTSQKRITFTSFLTSWKGISITNPTDTSKFKFCIIQEVFQQNDDTIKNGAIEISSSKVVIENSVFRMNNTIYGGGLFASNSRAIIKNNIFIYNDAGIFGGAMFLDNSSADIINNTVYRNSCFNFGGGIVLWEPLSTNMQNNIIYNNFSFTGDNRIAIVSGDSSNINEQYNYLAFGEMDPMFISGENLHLSSGSPSINNGNPDPLYNDVDGTRNDQGAFGGPGGNW